MYGPLSLPCPGTHTQRLKGDRRTHLHTHTGTSATKPGQKLALRPSQEVRRHSKGQFMSVLSHTSLLSLLRRINTLFWGSACVAGPQSACPPSIMAHFGVYVAQKRTKMTLWRCGWPRGHLPRPPWPPPRARRHHTAKKLNRKTRKLRAKPSHLCAVPAGRHCCWHCLVALPGGRGDGVLGAGQPDPCDQGVG